MELLDLIAQWPGAVLLRRSSLVYLLTNATHILAIALLVGPIVTLDTRILGLFGHAPLPPLHHILMRMGVTGFALAVVTGLALFSVRPIEYVQNQAFLVKLAIILLAALNLLLLSRLPSWQIARAGGAVSGSVRLLALISILLWLVAIVAGRWIGFV